ncbi:hypothetical protein BH747_02170 [Enterococcus villorum]|uniref:Uncharacterized protein n=1 Tax=Enterococcus villorum TaxID=112904 RepID=A0A1V8YGG5_9ENTE|nr:hypothetical protein BH747_02170 [Enterococcus villorum]OQO71704.1 hypothetical protein BH744_13970 [Enterococcus villorum]
MKLKHRIVQVKQLLKEQVCKDDKFSLVKAFELFAKLQMIVWIVKTISIISVYILSIFIEFAPVLKAFFEFLENLASTLSYKNKKEFFYGFF